MIKEWLKETFQVKRYGEYEIASIRHKITCNDGFSMSVQASDGHYCNPRRNLPDGDYSTAEIGFPSAVEELISEYAEDSSDLTETVYGYVPIEVVDAVIQKHGGISTGKETWGEKGD